MYDFLIFVIVVYLGIRLVRYFVWRGRFASTTQLLAAHQSQLAKLFDRVEVLEAELVAARRAARPLAIPVPVVVSAPIAASVPEPVAPPPAPMAEPEPATSVETPVPAAILAAEAIAPALPEEPEPAAEPSTPPASAWDSPWGTAAVTPWGTAPVSTNTPAAPLEPAAETAAPQPFRRDPIGRIVSDMFGRIRATGSPDAAPAATPTPSLGERLGAAFAQARGNEGLEALIGTSWLNKIGVAVLVIGIALLSGYSLQYLPAIGKLALGAAIALGLLGLGVWLERKERFTLFARPLIGGGWALLYFIAYAAHSIPASRIFDDTQGLVALFVVAAGMIAHSLKYRSEMVTGIAYLLGFLAILIGGLQLSSLLPIGLLAASFVVIFRFIPWYRLSAGMIVATYAALWLWMTGNAPTGPVPESTYWLIETILVIYWAIFAACDYLRRADQPQQQALQNFGVIFNTVAFTVLSAIMATSAYPHGTHLFTAAIAAGGLAAGLLAAWRARRLSYLFHVLFAGAAAAIAVPFAVIETGLAGEWLGLGWTVLAALLFAAGLRLREPLFRAGGYLAALLGAVATLALAVAAAHLGPLGPSGDLTLRLFAIAAVAIALIAGEWIVAARRATLTPGEPALGRAFGWIAALLLAAGVPVAVTTLELSGEWLALGWLALAVAFFALGLFRRHASMRGQSYVVAALATAATIAFAVFTVELGPLGSSGNLTLRLATIGIVAVVLIGAEWILSARRGTLDAGEGEIAVGGSWAGALLLAAAVPVAIAGLTIPGEWLAVAWLGLAALLFAIALRRDQAQMRYEAYFVAALATAAAFVIGVFSVPVGPIVPADLLWLRLFTVGIVALALLGSEWLTGRLAAGIGEFERRLAPLTGYAGVALLFCLALRDVEAPWLGLVWLAGGLVSFELGMRLRHPHSRFRGYLLLAAALGALFVNNSNLVFLAAHPVEGPLSWLPLGLSALGYWFAGFRLRGAAPDRVTAAERQLMPLLLHAGTAVAATLVWNELPMPAIGLGWALLALAAHETSARLREPIFRHQAYLLVAFAWVRLFMSDFVSEFVTLGAVGPLSSRVLAALPIAALLYYFRHATPLVADNGIEAKLESRLPVLFSFAATLALFALGRFEFGFAAAVVVWAVLAVGLLVAGVRTGLWDYRIEAYLIGIVAFVRSWSTNVHLDGDFYGVPERLATTIPVVLMLVGLALLWRQRRAALALASAGLFPRIIGFIDTQSRPLFATLSVILAGVYLFYAVEGNGVTIAWAVEAVVAIGIGFVLKERPFRLLGLAALAVCLGKGFIFDLNGVDTIFRIASFIVLGLILLGISFVYTRYRHVLRNYI